MTVFYKFKGRLRFETEVEASKFCQELTTSIFSLFWRLNPNNGLRRIYSNGKNLYFNAEIYASSFEFSDTLKVLKEIAIVAKSGRVRVYKEIYEGQEFQEIIPEVVRRENKKLEDYIKYLESLGKDVLDDRKSSYERFLELKKRSVEFE